MMSWWSVTRRENSARGTSATWLPSGVRRSSIAATTGCSRAFGCGRNIEMSFMPSGVVSGGGLSGDASTGDVLSGGGVPGLLRTPGPQPATKANSQHARDGLIVGLLPS